MSNPWGQLVGENRHAQAQAALSGPGASLVTRRVINNGMNLEAPVREFSPAEKSLISKAYTFMTRKALLDVLNERLVADQGKDADLYTITQRDAEITKVQERAPQPTSGWAGMRRLLAEARRTGLLPRITDQVVSDRTADEMRPRLR